MSKESIRKKGGPTEGGRPHKQCSCNDPQESALNCQTLPSEEAGAGSIPIARSR